MRFTTAFTALAILLTPILAAPSGSLHTVEKFQGETTGRYIVTFKSGFDKSSLRFAGITHEWDKVINGIAGHFDETTLEALRANPNVESISEDGIMHTMTTQFAIYLFEYEPFLIGGF